MNLGHDSNNYVGDIEQFLQRSEAVITELLSAIEQYRASRENHLEESLRAQIFSTDSKSTQFLNQILLQLDSIHQIECKQNINIIENVSTDLSHLTLVHIDDKNRKHELRLELSLQFPTAGPTISTDLPIPFHSRWEVPPKSFIECNHSTLSRLNVDYGLLHLYNNFQQKVSTLQPLWNELNDIDKNTWVLEPSLPARYSSVQRRVVLQTGISIVFTIDILNSSNVRSQNCELKTSSPPSFIRFIGAPASTIKELRSKYLKYINVQTSAGKEDNAGNHESFEGWRSDFSIRENFTKCFGPLPTPMTSEKSNFVTECGICYSHELPLSSLESPNEDENNAAAKDGEKFVLPDETCPNPKCARSFHECCLYLWLNSLPSVRITFDRIIGSCPYCSEPISAQVRS